MFGEWFDTDALRVLADFSLKKEKKAVFFKETKHANIDISAVSLYLLLYYLYLSVFSSSGTPSDIMPGKNQQ